ncbi:MAG: symmetrical bis(5'-nucleosyl)-tetraphosphatase [Pseudomonadota bacterium]
MKKFVIGDIQGCYTGLRTLLNKAKFKPDRHKLVAVGDLVARGEDSLNTLLMLMDMGDGFDTVLGNHDLHLIAIAHGIRSPKPNDNLDNLLKHSEFPKIVDWLLTKPLAIRIKPKTLIVHAGLYPQWSFKQAIAFSDRIQQQLQSDNIVRFLDAMYGNEPAVWRPGLTETDENRFIVNAMTRMRYITPSLALEFTTKCHPSAAPHHLLPWFLADNKQLKSSQRIIFGHWASLHGLMCRHHISGTQLIGLDTGYVWGNKMSLFNLQNEDITVISA